jgi:hypothetical protein
VKSIVWMTRPGARAFCERIGADVTVVSSLDEFVNIRRDAETLSFIDSTTIAALDELAAELDDDEVLLPERRRLAAAVSLGPVILIADDPAAIMPALPTRPWLSHVIGAAFLEQPLARTHLDRVVEAVTTSAAPRLMDWVEPEASGRRVGLLHASRRFERLERMGEYLASKRVGPAVVQQLRDTADELLTNAFYNAPFAAGAVEQPIPRTEDVSLPKESACDLAYGVRDDLAFVRVRDPFGSLPRVKLLDVIARSARAKSLDATPGTGRGLWRVLSTASVAAVSVISNQHTEVLVGIIEQASTASRPFAFHLFFKDSAKRRLWQSARQDTAITDQTMNNTLVSIVVAKDEIS